MDCTIHKTAAHDARAVLCAQIGEALRCLEAERDAGDRIHAARKAIKRSRATLRLLRGTLPDRTYRLENATLRDAAKPLSALRDARALVESLDDLLARRYLERTAAASFRQALEEERRKLDRDATRDGGALRRTRAALHRARDRIARSKLDSRGWPDLGDGLQHVYARGRKALRASKKKRTAKCLHEWRKQSKYLLYQLQLLRPNAPERIDELARSAHRLSNRLGDDHDLTVLRRKASEHRAAFARRRDHDALVEAIVSCQSRLRKKAFEIGAKIYESKPAHFRARFDRYWKNAREPAHELRKA
jgi:CHAD domain-containing protein